MRTERKWGNVGLNEGDAECHRVNVSISVTLNAARQAALQTSLKMGFFSVKGRVCPLLTAFFNYTYKTRLISLMSNVRRRRPFLMSEVAASRSSKNRKDLVSLISNCLLTGQLAQPALRWSEHDKLVFNNVSFLMHFSFFAALGRKDKPYIYN